MPAPSKQQTLTLDQALSLGIKHHNNGKLNEAEDIYQQILRSQPNHPTALHNLGLIAHQVGKNNIGLELIQKALSIKEDYAEAHSNLSVILLQLGKTEKAQMHCQEALKINPEFANAHCNLGEIFKACDNLIDAENSFLKAIQLHPNHTEAHNNLGSIYFIKGNRSAAEKSFKKVLKIETSHAKAHNNLAFLFLEKGELKKADKHCREALNINSSFVEAHNTLGNISFYRGQIEEAEKSYLTALEIAPHHTSARENLITLLISQGKSDEALSHCQEILRGNPNNINAQLSYANCMNALVPPWHIAMMNDDIRNEAYLGALKSAVTKKSHIFEIGTGSGLLSMMAARCGSHHITTCEMVPIIAKTATNIIADNDLSDIITVIAKKSTNLAIGIDLPKPADIIVSEILSSEFLGEGVLSSIEDAKQRLLAPEGQIIPRSGSIRIALFGGEHIGKNLHVSHVNDFDLSKFNGITSSKKSFDANLYNIKLYSDAIDAFSFDFVEQDYFPVEEKNIQIPVLRGGICHGIIQWVHMNMDEEITFENHPQIKTQASGWKHVIYAFPSPIDLKKKQIINILAKHNRIAPWFKFLSIEDA